MTENQEKELFNILSTLVTEVRAVKSDVVTIKETQSEHSKILNEHSQILNEHSNILNEHSKILDRLDAKTDTIAEKVISHENRLTKAEKDIKDLQSGIH